MISHAHRDISQIGSHSYLDSFRAKRKADRIGRVVRDGERLHRNIADLEAVSRLELLKSFQLRSHTSVVPHRPLPRLIRGTGHEDWDAQLLCQRCQSVNVVAVLVGDQDRRQRIRIIAKRLHAFECLAAGNSRVDQDLRGGAGNYRTVPAAPRSQHGDTYTHARKHTRQSCGYGSYFLVSRYLRADAGPPDLPASLAQV